MGHIIRLIVVALVLASADPASAQHVINLSSGGADQTYTGAAGSRAGASLDQGAIGGGDGRRDLIIGAPGGSVGRVYILFGGPARSTSPLESEAETIITGPGSFGAATASGNVTGIEGSSPRNLVVGAPDAGDGRGRVYVFAANFTAGQRTTEASAAIVITGAAGDRLGSAIATADLDNDGRRELILGAPGTDRVYILYGATLTSRDLTAGADAVIVGHPTNGSAIGHSLVAGPVTGDDIYDLAIGEPAVNSVYLISGRDRLPLPARIDLPAGGAVPAPLPAGITSMFIGADAGDEAGTILRVADPDGNNALDLLIGAPGGDGRSNSASDAGEVYVLWNEQTSTSGSLARAGAIFYGGQSNQRMGSAFATGDINRDSPNDLVFRMNYGAGGEARVYYGRSRSAMGPLVAGTRVIDFGVQNQENRIIINDATNSLMTAMFVFEVTGEGARDIVLADAAAQSGAGKVFLTISPKLQLSTSTLAVTLKEGQSSTSSVAVHNQSPISITWAVAPRAGTPWLSTTPSGGTSNSASSGTFQLTTNAGALAPGTYTGAVDVPSTSADLTMTRTVAVNLTVQASRFLTVESPANGASLTQPFTVTGWAIDTAASTGTGVDWVNVYAVPTGGGTRRLLGTATYGQARPAVGTTYGARFANSGFSLTVSSAPGGTFALVAEAHSTANNAIWNKAGSAPVVSIAGVPSAVDMNNDGFVDVVWQNTSSGALTYWSMNGVNMVAGGPIGSGQLPAGRWEVRAVADMNGDNRPDLVLQELNTGDLLAWLLNGTTLLEARPLSPSRLNDASWRVVAAADFNSDGKTDLIFQHMTQGTVAAWLMNGTTILEGVALNPSRVSELSWKIIGAGDVNDDGKPDLIWQNDRTRVLTSWLMDGTTMVAGGPFSVPGPSDVNWQARAVADINGDGNVDLLWQHVTEGYIAAWLLDGRTFLEARLLNPGRVNLNWWLAGPR